LTLSDNQTLRQALPATIMPSPRRRILILIAAAFPSRSPRYRRGRFRNRAYGGDDDARLRGGF